MGDWALAACERVENLSPNKATYGGANAKGAWVQLTAATSFAYSAMRLQFSSDVADGGPETYLADLGMGSAGAEVVLVPDVLVDLNRVGIAAAMVNLLLPLQVPAGARLALRGQTAGGAGTRNVWCLAQGRNGGANDAAAATGVVTTYGALPASTNGTLVDQGAVSNVYGAWTQITASTSSAHSWLCAVVGQDKQTTAFTASGSDVYMVQLGAGGAGAEVVIDEFAVPAPYAANTVGAGPLLNCNLPAGTRLAARCKALTVTAVARHMTLEILAG